MLCLFYYKSSFSYFPGFCWLLPLSQKLGILIALMVAPWFAYWPQLGSQLEEVLTILPPALYLWSILPGSLLSFSGEKAPNSAIRPHSSPGIICSIYLVLSLGIYPSVLSCKVTSPLVTLTNPRPSSLRPPVCFLGTLHIPHTWGPGRIYMLCWLSKSYLESSLGINIPFHFLLSLSNIGSKMTRKETTGPPLVLAFLLTHLKFPSFLYPPNPLG